MAKERVAAMAILLLLLITYSPLANNGFVLYDDPIYVTENHHVHQGLSWANLRWAFSTTRGGNWHPITWLSHQIDCAIFGLNPLGHHLMSLFIHWCNVCLLLFLLSRATKDFSSSFICALFFALHPLAVDSVAWVSERKNLLCLFFWLLSLLAHGNYVHTKNSSWRLLLFVAMFLALASKPMAVTLPFTLLLVDYWPLRRNESLFVLVKEKIHLFVFTFLFSALTYLVQGASGAITSRFALKTRLGNSVVTYLRYCYTLVVPLDLAVFYPFPDQWVSKWGVLGCSLLLIAFSAAFFRLRKSAAYSHLGWCWFLGTLFPVIGLVQAGLAARTDRHTYIPFIGLFVLISFGLTNLCHERRNIKMTIVVISCLFWAVLSWQQVHHWRDSVTLFSQAAKVTRENYVTANNLGFALLSKGDLVEAEKWLKKAVELDKWYAPSLNNMGILKKKMGKIAEAESWHRRAIAQRPDHPGAHAHLGMALLAQGRLKAAKSSFEAALLLDDELADVHFQLGLLSAKKGSLPDAIRLLLQAVRLRPMFAQAHNNLGVVLAMSGDKQQAIKHFRQALAIDGKYSEAKRNLSRALGSSQNP